MKLYIYETVFPTVVSVNSGMMYFMMLRQLGVSSEDVFFKGSSIIISGADSKLIWGHNSAKHWRFPYTACFLL